MSIRTGTPVFLLLCCSLAGCGTPDEVREYAKITDTHISSISQQLSNFGRWENGVIQSRRDTALQLNRYANETDDLLKRAVSRVGTEDEPCKSSREECIRLYELVLTQHARWLQTAVNIEQGETAFAKSLDAKLTPIPEKLTSIKANLDLASKSAVSLSQELSKKEQAEFLFRFGKQVKKSYDDSREQAEKQKDKEADASN